MSNLKIQRVDLLLPFTNYLQQLGAPVERGLAKAGIPAHCLDDSTFCIPTQSMWRFAGYMSRLEGIPNLGAEVGEAAGASGLNASHRGALMGTETLFAGLKLTRNDMAAETSGSHIRLHHLLPGRFRITHHATFDATHPQNHIMSSFAIFSLIEIVRLFAGASWQPREVGFMSTRPDVNFKESLPPGPTITLGNPFNYLDFDSDTLSLPPKIDNPDSNNAIDTAARDHLPDSLAAALGLLVDTFLLSGKTDLNSYAEMVEQSSRSLQRNLISEGTCFRDILLKSRYRHAVKLLIQRDYPVSYISDRLGYRNQSHFSRAFSSIAGVSPQKYRTNCTTSL